MLAVADTLIRKYHKEAWCKGKGGKIDRDFPSPGAFAPDVHGEVSVYHLRIWDQNRIRTHISACKRPRDGRAYNHADFGLAALSIAAIEARDGYKVHEDPVTANEFDPGNPAHHVVRAADSPEEVTNFLYGLALGFSPPPALTGMEIRSCPPWSRISTVAGAV
jgi:hypothetical protein